MSAERYVSEKISYQNNNTLKNSGGIKSDVQDIIDQLFELFWCQLVEYTPHLKNEKKVVKNHGKCWSHCKTTWIGRD